MASIATQGPGTQLVTVNNQEIWLHGGSLGPTRAMSCAGHRTSLGFSAMLATHLDYRPTVTDGGRHQNRRGKRWRFGKPFDSPRWRIIAVEDGVIQWTCRGETVNLEPGSWGIQQPDSASEPLYISKHSRWCELRFSAMPSQRF